MTTLFPRLCGLAAIAILTACGNSLPGGISRDGASAPPAAPPQLRRDGRWLVDPQNRVVLLHGMNLIWKIEPYYPPEADNGFLAQDAQWFADHGFNAARIGTLWVGVTPDAPGVVDTAFLDQWQRIIDQLAAQKVWMLFDFHQDMMTPEYQGEGIPDWAVEPLKGPVNAALPPLTLGFPFNYFTPQVSELFDNLWKENGPVRDGFRDAWIAVARRWKDQPYSMGYDLLNEPWAGLEWPTCLLVAGSGIGGCPNVERDEIQPFMEHARQGIRTVDANNLVWFEPQLLSGGSGLPTGFVAVPGENQLGYSFHNYCPHAALLQSAQAGSLPLPVDLSTTCAPFIDDVVAGGEADAARMNAVAAMTEFGASDDLTIVASTAASADAHLTSWFYWHYKNWADPTTQSQGTGAQGLFMDDADLSSVKLEKLKLLERTYPQATAGIPTSLSFDPVTGDFSYQYRPRAAGGPTEIYVPVALHYPGGYSVTVTGAHVTSAADAVRLTLDNEPGASEVSVSLKRR